MAINDNIMDEMASSDMSLSEKEKWIQSRRDRVGKPLVPRVDKHQDKKRWGVDTPMFESREDMHGFLQNLGMAPGGLGADFLDAALYMSEGEFQEALISIGAAVPLLGMGATVARKGKKAYDTSKATMRYGGQKQRADRFKEGLKERKDLMDKERIAQKQINQSDLAQRRVARTNEARAAKEQIRQRTTGSLESDIPGIRTSRDLGELSSATYKVEEYVQRSKMPLKQFIEQVKKANPRIQPTDNNMELITEHAKLYRKNYLIGEAQEKGVLTFAEAKIYRDNALLQTTKVPGGRKAINRIEKEVRQSLHAEDISKAGIGVEITPKGVRATGKVSPDADYNSDVFDLLPK